MCMFQVKHSRRPLAALDTVCFFVTRALAFLSCPTTFPQCAFILPSVRVRFRSSVFLCCRLSLLYVILPAMHTLVCAQHHPSCAVYQQTPGGKALVHRARMPSVSPRKRGRRVSMFAAALPRSVVVEGTFQVRA